MVFGVGFILPSTTNPLILSLFHQKLNETEYKKRYQMSNSLTIKYILIEQFVRYAEVIRNGYTV